MDLILSKIRIRNYRSIENISLDLGMLNLLIGQNNTGKTNFLKALNLVISGGTDISEDDIFVENGERLESTKTATIDIAFQPVDENGNLCMQLSEFWRSVFTVSLISTFEGNEFVGIRTEIKFDETKDSYILSRKSIRVWGKSIDEAAVDNKNISFNDDMRTYMYSFYMDANRDIVQDLRSRKSYFGRITSSYDLKQDDIDQIEKQLNAVNAKIIKSIPSLQQTKERISTIGQTIGSESGNIEIEPLPRKIADLNKGMDIVMRDGDAALLPIAQQGYGTRSWISFLTLSAFIDNQNEKLKKSPDAAEQYIMLTMEEPEAHLHPQAQRQLFRQISHFQGQKVVSTHSPSVVAQSRLNATIHFTKKAGRTTAKRYIVAGSVSGEEKVGVIYREKATVIDEEKAGVSGKNKAGVSDEGMIFREVLNTRADLLFATAVILCEGITEEQALAVYFEEYFKYAPYSLGVSIIGVGGVKYKPYLSLIKDFDIPWFIFSDGEKKTIEDIKSAVSDVFNLDVNNLLNIVILDNGDDYEKYLIKNGYSEIIKEAICELLGNKSAIEEYIKKMANQKGKGGTIRDYSSQDGAINALIDLYKDHKADYAVPIANKIVRKADKGKKVPAKVETLFSILEKKSESLIFLL